MFSALPFTIHIQQAETITSESDAPFPPCEHTHALQQGGRRRPGASQVLNEELCPVAVFLLDGYKDEEKTQGLRI